MFYFVVHYSVVFATGVAKPDPRGSGSFCRINFPFSTERKLNLQNPKKTISIKGKKKISLHCHYTVSSVEMSHNRKSRIRIISGLRIQICKFGYLDPHGTDNLPPPPKNETLYTAVLPQSRCCLQAKQPIIIIKFKILTSTFVKSFFLPKFFCFMNQT